MSMDLTENTVGLWYISYEYGNWMATVNKLDGEENRYNITHRFRYYHDDLVGTESKDHKSWYEGIMTCDSREQVIKEIRSATEVLENHPAFGPVAEKTIELLKEEGENLDSFRERFLTLPFVHTTKVTKEEYEEKYGKDVTH